MRTFLLLFLVACAEDELPMYWSGSGPVIEGHYPLGVDSLLGGETLTISGQDLTGTQTVIVGGRNAEILSVSDQAVEVIVPKGSPGGGLVDVSVVTDQGQSTMEACFEYASPGSALWSEERTSAALYNIRCPIELQTQTPSNGFRSLWWCGFEGGWADAYGFGGASPQPSFAAELMGFAGLNTLPAKGESRVLLAGERVQPSPPLIYGVHPDEEILHIVTQRDLDRDLDYMWSQMEYIQETYSYGADLYDIRAMAWMYGEDECLAEGVEILDSDWNSLNVDGFVDGITGIQLGLQVSEDWGPKVTETYAIPTSTAAVCGTDDTLTAKDSGVQLRYDSWSGYFYPDAVGGLILPGDIPTSARYQISHERLGQIAELGVVRGVEALDLISPPILGGVLQATTGVKDAAVHDIGFQQEFLGLDGSLTIEWEPGIDSDEGTFISIELIYYDANIDDPMYMTEVGRIVAQGDDSVGMLTIPVDQLLSLPQAPNRVDTNIDMIGKWAELSVVRHQLRVLEMGDDQGDLVIDFVDAIQGPISIYHP